jgi:hypothetical protein
MTTAWPAMTHAHRQMVSAASNDQTIKPFTPTHVDGAVSNVSQTYASSPAHSGHPHHVAVRTLSFRA